MKHVHVGFCQWPSVASMRNDGTFRLPELKVGDSIVSIKSYKMLFISGHIFLVLCQKRSPLENLYGGQFTFSINSIASPPIQHHGFLRKYPLLHYD